MCLWPILIVYGCHVRQVSHDVSEFLHLYSLSLTMLFLSLKKWIPVIKENWATAKKKAEPYVQMVSAKSVELYQASKDAISPHVVKAHELADPYFQVH